VTSGLLTFIWRNEFARKPKAKADLSPRQFHSRGQLHQSLVQEPPISNSPRLHSRRLPPLPIKFSLAFASFASRTTRASTFPLGVGAGISMSREWRWCDESGWNAGKGAWTSAWIWGNIGSLVVITEEINVLASASRSFARTR